jgi:PTS system nitrogen regulatory IIA component
MCQARPQKLQKTPFMDKDQEAVPNSCVCYQVITMKISEILYKDYIIPELKARDKKGVLEEMVDAICRQDPGLAKEDVVNVLMERERLGTTGIGDGTAIPHGKINALKKPVVLLGKSSGGIDFDAIDGQPVYIVFLLLAPENSAEVHLQILAKIARILKNSSLRKQLLEAKTKKEIFRKIVDSEIHENGQ